MKKILISITVLISLSLSMCAEDINECKTDIYYGNGVWNEIEDAKKSQKELEDEIVIPKIIKNNTALKEKYGKVKLSYNWGQGRLLDVLETYYQLREAGQLNGIGFFSAMAILTAYQPELTLGAIATQKLMEPYTKDWEQGNVDEMWQKYYYESFKLGHRVLLVSHSQGNLFANRVHDKITPIEYRQYFANLQVASPASEVKANEEGKGAYVTLFGDPIISPIPGSMSGNAHGSPGHKFISAYLDQEDPYNKIVSRIKALLPTLDAEISQWERDGELSNKNTCEERMKVKHSFDPSVYMPFDVYMFAPKKLYQVNGEWVMASCGGKNILGKDHEMPTWDGKKDSECYMIDNPQKEKISKEDNVTVLPYRYVTFVLLRIHDPSKYCDPLVDAKIAIVGNGNKVIKIIHNPTMGPGKNELTKFIGSSYGNYYRSYRKSIFYTTQSLNDLKSKIDHVWNMTVEKYRGAGGVGGGGQCPSDTESISYQFTQDDLNAILKK